MVSMADKTSTWVDSDLCSGCGLCVESLPEVFAHDDTGVCRVKKDKELVSGPDGLVEVPAALTDKLIATAEECPGECIFIEME